MGKNKIYKANFETVDKIEALQILADKASLMMGSLIYNNIETLSPEYLEQCRGDALMTADIAWDYVLKLKKELDKLFDNIEMVTF